MLSASDEVASVLEDFRKCFQRHVTTVTIVSAASAGRRAGLAATAVCSLSDTPPSLLVSINQKARACELIRTSKAFAVNVLAAEQMDIAKVFARSARDDAEAEAKFLAAGHWERKGELPWLQGSLANVCCELLQEVHVASHSVFIGVVKDIRVLAEGTPLLYGFKEFHRVGNPIQNGRLETVVSRAAPCLQRIQAGTRNA
jgi:flavin reductase (DIM6/NTAB) family NADH-FMN oxidoreductase RutF